MAVVSVARVKEVIVYSDTVREYSLEVDTFELYEPGQFLQLSLSIVDASSNWPESRTFSIASYNPTEGTLRLIIKKTGVYTTRIFEELQVGNECTVKYAYGDFLLPMFDEEESIHCLAGGTGIAPFLSFMEYLKNEGQIKRFFLYYSAQSGKELVRYQDCIDTLEPGQTKFYCTQNESERGLNRRIQIEDVIENVVNITEEHFYICGSSQLTKEFKEKFIDLGAENIYLDEWD